VPNPDGIFADHNRTVPYLKMGLPAGYAGAMSAAHGVDMATPDGCRELIDGRAWIADLPSRTTKALHAVCEREVDVVRASLALPAPQLNAAAAAGYDRFVQAWDAALTPEQHARVDAIAEHGSHGGHASTSAREATSKEHAHHHTQ
jgi:hypothetical protein